MFKIFSYNASTYFEQANDRAYNCHLSIAAVFDAPAPLPFDVILTVLLEY